MKEYIDQIFNEGFGTNFYLKPKAYLNKKIKNEKVKKFLNSLFSLIYLVAMLILAIYVLFVKLS